MTKMDPNNLSAINSDDNNNNEQQDDNNDEPSMSLIPFHDWKNRYLYRPSVVSKEENIYPTSTSMSLANGRRFLVTGNTKHLPGQEFLEDITNCLSNTKYIHMRTTNDFSHGSMGFTSDWCYEVLNDNKLRICVIGFTVYPKFYGFYFFIANPFGEDAFTYQMTKDPNHEYIISGPGIASCDIKRHKEGIAIFTSKKKWFVMNNSLIQLIFPYWIFPFYKGKSGSKFEITSSGLEIEKTVARMYRDSTMENDQFLTMKIEFDPSLLAEDRIAIFATSLYYAFLRRYDPVGVWSHRVGICILYKLFIFLIVLPLSGIEIHLPFESMMLNFVGLHQSLKGSLYNKLQIGMLKMFSNKNN